MESFITGAVIKRLREEKGLTQSQLAESIGVTGKAVSKWETAKGLPDISLIEPLSKALGVSVMELMSGKSVINKNVSGNMLRSRFYVCPVCGNVIYSAGEALISCCGITLFSAEAEQEDEEHKITIEKTEDEYFITVEHEMTKAHYISFIAHVTCDKIDFRKLYPEMNAETRMKLRGKGVLYIFCNRHGLIKRKL